MKVIHTVSELQRYMADIQKQQKAIGFVPTMGALHSGHLSLMKRARQENDVLVLSIFVNPLQFGPNEDYEDYPRTLDKDKDIARTAGVDIIFSPGVRDIYPRPMRNEINVISGTDVLCGKSRPGHFNGVATVVLKLFQLVQPDRAYFGQKDAQQVAVIKNMVDDFHLSVDIRTCETARENDGLAVSSRNVYLSERERSRAVHLYKGLQHTLRWITGQAFITPAEAEQKLQHYLQEHIGAQMDYVQVLSFPELKPLHQLEGSVIVACAVFFEKARLIDNVLVHVEKGRGGYYDVSYIDEI
ncbi:pantothenate synthetase [Alteribacillus persepolensis]|uniref:Pantothenate synthetase n=1 Tax=Alteribacillus persepolensis TaxID=568899 RepID=A0A1G7ZD82_9BACI|nr:pantoate--beta-alanine ligase [Alteribacillus persepolensis]SDH06658.1 pantothenate synthetase [Alteribacillus persepolensis]